MSLTGIARKIDQLGRVVIPSEMRKQLDLSDGDLVSISVDDRRVVLEKVEATCVFCRASDDLSEFAGRWICTNCASEITRRTGDA